MEHSLLHVPAFMVPIEPLTLGDSIATVVPMATTMLGFVKHERAKARARLEVEKQFGYERWYQVEQDADFDP